MSSSKVTKIKTPCLLLQTLNNTFGWKRVSVVGSISSLIFLFSLCFATAIEALQTLFHSDHLHTLHHPDWVIICSIVNIILWFISYFTIGGFSYHQKLAVRQQSQDRNSNDTSCSTVKEKPSYCSRIFKRTKFSDVLRDMIGSFFSFLTSGLVYFKVSVEK